jgi:hypothetical protein
MAQIPVKDNDAKITAVIIKLLNVKRLMMAVITQTVYVALSLKNQVQPGRRGYLKALINVISIVIDIYGIASTVIISKDETDKESTNDFEGQCRNKIGPPGMPPFVIFVSIAISNLENNSQVKR